jgi:hypothetical protein
MAAVLAVLTCLCATSADAQSAAGTPNPVFELKDFEVPYRDFWKWNDPSLKEYLIGFYGKHRNATETSFAKAEVTYLLGRIKEDKDLLCESLELYEKALDEVSNPELVYQILFMVSDECGGDHEAWLDQVIEHTEGWKQDFYRKLKEGDLRFEIRKIEIAKKIDVPEDVSRVILGNSRIEVKPGSRIGFQMERVYRDWLSNMVDVYPYDEVPRGKIITWHEGSRLRDILASGLDFTLVPLTGAIFVQASDGMWYAPDENGVFRFRILRDKILYQTTKSYKNVCFTLDTHGISALVPQAIAKEVNLVIGCGDHTCKMEAAYYLATKGIDVFFPADRFIADIIGYDAEGTLIGTAPVRGSIIGDQPVAIDTKELIIVEDISKPYPAQYYDAPKRYFTELGKLVELNLDFVKINNLGETYMVVDRARETGAKVIAVRVFDDKDYESVSKWLGEDKGNRAILFHTSLYPAHRLFDEFPEQTSFGDPKPLFE